MKKLVGFALLATVGWLGWRAWRAPAATVTDGGQALVFDRVWIDHLPRSEKDQVQVFLAVTDQPLGVFDARSKWKGSWELFKYEARSDGQIDLVYPQSGSKESARYTARACSEKKFDYCLEIAGSSHGAKRYFSRKGWEIGAASPATPVAATAQGVSSLEERGAAVVQSLPLDE